MGKAVVFLFCQGSFLFWALSLRNPFPCASCDLNRERSLVTHKDIPGGEQAGLGQGTISSTAYVRSAVIPRGSCWLAPSV